MKDNRTYRDAVSAAEEKEQLLGLVDVHTEGRHDDVAVVRVLVDGKVVLECAKVGVPNPVAGIHFSISTISRRHRLEEKRRLAVLRIGQRDHDQMLTLDVDQRKVPLCTSTHILFGKRDKKET